MDTDDSAVRINYGENRYCLTINFEKGIVMESSVKSGRLMLLMVLAFVMAGGVKVLAQSDVNASNKKEVLTSLERRMQKKISVDFSNLPIDEVLRIMAEQAGVDIIKNPTVTGNVTAKLTDVPLAEALANILAAHGYGYVTTENMIRVAPMEEIGKITDRLVSKIYRITYADVKEVEASLKKFISSRGSLSSNPGTSNIIVTDTENQMKAIDTFIAEIDRITPQLLVEARIYDITCKDRLDLGIEWEAGRNTTFPAGIGTNPSAGRTDPFIKAGFLGATSKTEDTTGAVRIGWLNDSIDVDAILRAQKETINAKLLANPRILVLDNKRAEIKIVSQIPYQQLNQGIGASGTFGTTAFREVGVTLEVTPHLTRDGMISLQLKPKFSVQTGEVNVGQSTENYPQPVIDERQADTTLLVKDGQTVALGGLRKKEATKQIDKIPLLGDLPVVGAFFRFEGEETVTSEIVVFITPHIIEQPTMTPKEAAQFETTEFNGPQVTATRAEKDAK